MTRIQSADDLRVMQDNSFFGELPSMENSSIIVNGTGNCLYFEEGVKLVSSRIALEGNNGLVMLGKNSHVYRMDVSINSNCSAVFGRDIYFNSTCHIIVSEGCSVIVGDDCLVSFGVWVRTADPHLIYDCDTHKRINASKNVVIGDHVWIGQNALILKGSVLGSGSIIGAMSLISGKAIPSNTIWGGNPAKLIKSNVFWEGSCVHKWTPKKTKKRLVWNGSEYIYQQDDSYLLATNNPFPKGALPAAERLEWYRNHGYENRERNRFAIDEQSDKRKRTIVSALFGSKTPHA